MKKYFTTRADGNLAFHVGDAMDVVHKNHLRLARKLSYAQERLVHMKQIHSNSVHVVSDEDGFATPLTCDALVTNKKNTPLMVMVADCTPLLFWDPICRAIGVAHAGRAGAFSNIVKNVIEILGREYGSQAQNIEVTIGSSIGVCCYEVGREILEGAKEFDYAFEEREEKQYLNVNKILLMQLKACGIKETHIKNEGICTACNTKTHFSYRKEGKTGRFAGVLMLKD